MRDLQQPDNYETLKAKINSAAIVGHTTHTTTKIWVRAFRQGKWTLIVSTTKLPESAYDLSGKDLGQMKAHNSDIVFLEERDITRTTDQTMTFEVSDLTPDTRYYYYLASDDPDLALERKVELGGDHQYWFRTLAKNPQSLLFGFYSCHDPFSVKPNNEGAWDKFYDVLNERQADFVIGGGDQVYCDTNHASQIQDVWVWLKNNKNALLAKYRKANGSLDEPPIIEYFTKLYRTYYRIYWQFEHLRYVYRRFPQYMIWDDHEIMDGWGSLTEEERKAKLANFFQNDDENANYALVMLMFKAAAQAYLEYQHAHNPDSMIINGDPGASHWDYNFDQGAYGFYMLDVRGHHDCEQPDGQRLLGADQFERFESWINSASIKKKKAIFICSPVPVVHWKESAVNTFDFGGQKDDFMDEWGHETNHAERNKILDLLLARSHENNIPIVILSGDVHCASAFGITHAQTYPGARLFNVTSSAISRSPAPGIATAAMQKSAPIDGFDGGRFEQMFRFAGENNFAVINADCRDGELQLSATLYWAKPGSESVTQKVIRLGT
ncbi:alkaline phosphatase D family protein [Thalassospira alkalitolerans]|uniref:alkaline phosphatase D family protein n=1 Tax=Thalassospira alkalitolerans TaxID=1293890 RepID=UPI003AA90979